MATVTQSPEGNYLALPSINHRTNKTKKKQIPKSTIVGNLSHFVCQFSIHENCKSLMQKVYDMIRSEGVGQYYFFIRT